MKPLVIILWIATLAIASLLSYSAGAHDGTYACGSGIADAFEARQPDETFTAKEIARIIRNVTEKRR